MLIKGNANKLIGEIMVPGDKSISHRSIMIGSLANGNTVVRNILKSEDVSMTIDAFRRMGVDIEYDRNDVYIKGKGINGLKQPEGILDCGNSGTTMRIISGILVGQKFSTTLTGDKSLSKRPMDRIIIPLRKMNANISGREDKYSPINIKPVRTNLKTIKYKLPVASAQVKSSILLATLYARGTTTIIENKITRDHTERMLNYFGCPVINENGIIYMGSNCNLEGRNVYVPGDISSAAYFIVAASLIKDSNLIIRNVSINPTRIGIIHVLKKMKADIKILNKRILNNEPIGDIQVKYSPLVGANIEGEIIGTLIDEIPIIAVAASLAEGTTVIKNAEELKYKESNRISSISKELNKMGANIVELHDGMIIEGKRNLVAATLNSYNDHRIAMALSIAALRAEGQTRIRDFECIDVSYPNFYNTLYKLYL
ncbi:3-phosphoshikimate 1-carboxyvinyltransferase [Schnuerera sp. xch1]|uniref:3-phosphoshikimate 1-carboxyvinyltransferase n=1 Tax=Schnuerera sp. xch1 TaxID=2874283 RepID=UPI001CC0FA56|nr:3-phosphoshikimate 1-carboxyvinyltransferase [Schnuerera sp. xch1]